MASARHRTRQQMPLAILALISVALLLGTSARTLGQGSVAEVGNAAIRGRVVLPGGAFLTDGVRISLQTIRGIDSSVFTDSTGRFEFTRLAPGKYQILVDADKDRFETAVESVELVRNQQYLVTIVLSEKEPPGKPKTATVSAGELDPKVPSKAKKEFERGVAARQQGNTSEALAHLRAAIEIYPRFLMARNDLGAQLLDIGDLDAADQELRKALAIDAAAFNPNLNMGIVLVKKHDFLQALTFLEKAVSLQPQSPAARMYNGLALAGVNEVDRATKELSAAHDLGGPEYAIALFHLGQLLMDHGDRKHARDAFELYLREAPNAANAAMAQKLIGMLK